MHAERQGDAWLIGTNPLLECCGEDTVTTSTSQSIPRSNWTVSKPVGKRFAVAFDRYGKSELTDSLMDGDVPIMVLSEQVLDSYLAKSRSNGVPYIFAGKDDIDICTAIELLHSIFGISRLLLEGGGMLNGASLQLDFIDEISLIIAPIAVG